MIDTWPNPCIWDLKPKLAEKIRASGREQIERLMYVATPVRPGSTFGYEHAIQAKHERRLARAGIRTAVHMNPRNLWLYHEVWVPQKKKGRLGKSGSNYLRAFLPDNWWKVFAAVVESIDPTTGNCLPNIRSLSEEAGLSEVTVGHILNGLRSLGVLTAWRTRHGAAYTVLATGFSSRDKDILAPYTSALSKGRGWTCIRDGREFWTGPGQPVSGWSLEHQARWLKEPGRMVDEAQAAGHTPLESHPSHNTATAANVAEPAPTLSNQVAGDMRKRAIVRKAINWGFMGTATPDQYDAAIEYIREAGFFDEVSAELGPVKETLIDSSDCIGGSEHNAPSRCLMSDLDPDQDYTQTPSRSDVSEEDCDASVIS